MKTTDSMAEVEIAANGNVIDPHSGNEIRRTENGLKDGDVEAPQHQRPLAADEIAELVAKAVSADGDR